MKKIYISLILLVGLLASCSMDRKPYGSLDETSAIQSMNDITRFRNGVYTSLRSMSAGSWMTYSDIQMDHFHGLTSNGNRMGTFSNGSFTSADGDMEGFYSSCYAVIAKANYLIDKSAEFIANEKFADDVLTLKRYNAEACFLRAYAYFYLIDHFCQPIGQVDPEKEGLGVQIVTKYNPSGDLSTYPKRSSLAASYQLVEEDLKKAYDQLKEYEAEDKTNVAPNAKYLSSYAVAAMQARVALVKGDYATAKAKADEVINSKVYTLCQSEDELAAMWSEDTSNEIIFRPFSSTTEGLISTGSVWTASTDKKSADYIATFDVLALFPDDDLRWGVYFDLWTLDLEGTNVKSFVFLKYPGNESLYTTAVNNYCNMAKPFRLAEMYLIAAEAAAQTGGDASKYLNDFMATRHDGYQTANYNTSTAMAAVKAERQLELIGEGFRMSDLRRWHEGFQRYASHDENPALDSYIVARGAALKYEADDYRFTWPIPKTEMDANPNLAGQQNPGY